jgi:hypothetical protein
VITIGGSPLASDPGPSGGASLPPATGAGQIPTADGAGTAYTATDASAAVGAGLLAILGEYPAGTALVADGAGGGAPTSADVSAFNAAADAAAARTAIGVSAYTRLAEPFTVAAWSIVAATDPDAGTSAATFETGGVARITLGTTGAAVALTGPRVERALPTWDATARWRFRATLHARVNTSGNCNFDLYLRDSSGAAYRTIEITASATPGDVYLTGNGGVSVTGPTGGVAWDGTATVEIRYDGGKLSYGTITGAGVYTAVTPGAAEALAFVPSHVGVTGQVGVASAGYVEAIDPVIEVMR